MNGENIIRNRVSDDVITLLRNNKLMVLRDRKTLKPLGISYTEEGLRGVANKNGVYLYCKGRVTDFNRARKEEISPNVIVEQFQPRQFQNPIMASQEIFWSIQAKHLIGRQ